MSRLACSLVLSTALSTVLTTALVLAPQPASGVETPAAAAAGDPADRFDRAPSRGPVSPVDLPAGIDADRRVSVVLELAQDPVAVVAAEEGGDLTDARAAAIRRQLERAQAPVVDAVEDAGGSIEATLQSAYNGVQANIAAGEVEDLAARADVVGVYQVRAQTIENATSVPFLGVPSVWEDTGYTGQGVSVAVIDTGIDYTHAMFGGPGTAAAFETADATSTAPADPALFGPSAPRVKGGYDFVGDDYDAGDPASVPVPDPNPLDCQGHGTHVSGTAGGGGVTPDGAAYTGPYDAATGSADWRIGPGVAPQVDLYALRVFGCEGSTNLTVAAIDWAVENDMDVINMSLGSSLGRGDDPAAVASANAVGAGVVVVASAGNAGPSPYIAGSPGSGDGVISVAATDSTASFPGALLTVAGQEVQAINANGADLDGLGDLTVVRLRDDLSTTTENEALGCSVRAYTSNGVTAGAQQLAVSERGVCARAARAVFAQQAGAAAALMINNADTLPPFEGVITENPDTGVPFEVTIPFLGVASSDGPVFATGASVGVVGAVLDNPGFRGYPSFSSNGPRNGDSALSVDVAAPGVSIVSAAVGTGAGGSTLSGTSMAAPHVAGVAALTVQAKPRWAADDVSAAVVGTADPEGVTGQDLTRGGVGLVDAAQAVATRVTATGDSFRTGSGLVEEAALSFGFQETTTRFVGSKTVRVTNRSNAPVTYRASVEPTEESAAATVRLNRSTLTVGPGRTASLIVGLVAPAGAVPGSVEGDDPFGFSEFSGQVLMTPTESAAATSPTLRVPYLMVPRANSRVAATGPLTPDPGGADVERRVTLSNVDGAAAADADFYTWGLQDRRDLPDTAVDTGYDLAYVGAQTLDTDDGALLVFALNNHSRWSTAAVNSFEVRMDRDGDGQPDAVVFSADSGALRTGSANGVTEVFVLDVAAETVTTSGFLATAPTDSSTILLPVLAEDLGLSEGAGAFSYSAASYGFDNPVPDTTPGTASYDPWNRALEDGQLETVPVGGSLSVPVRIDGQQFAAQRPLGLLAVVLDNRAGIPEAQRVPAG